MPPIWLIVLIVNIIISVALAPKPTVPTAATLKDFNFPQATEGTPQMVIFGDVWVTGWTVLAYGDLTTEGIESSQGGKK